jgi:hypothetical protein
MCRPAVHGAARRKGKAMNRWDDECDHRQTADTGHARACLALLWLLALLWSASSAPLCPAVTMPSLSALSSLRVSTDNARLTVTVSHGLVVGQPSQKAYKLKASWPPNFDVYPATRVSLSLSGACGRNLVGGTDLLKSAVLAHLVGYLRTARPCHRGTIRLARTAF